MSPENINPNSENKQEDPQKKIVGQPAFKPKEETVKKTVNSESTTPVKNTTPSTKTAPQKPSFGLWLFFGVVIFMILVMMVAAVYILQTQGGENVFNAIGIPLANAYTGLRNIVNGTYIFITLILVIVMMTEAGIFASSKPKTPSRIKSIYGLIFSIFFIFLTGVSYVVIFPQLYKNISTETDINLAKYISYSPEPATGSAPLRVFFNASAIDDVNENLFYEWDFGDESDLGTGPTPSHEYTKPGMYEVKLTISNAQESQEVDTEIVVRIHNSSSIPRIVSDVTQGKAPLEVNFDASSSKDPNGEILEFLWDFDDLESSQNQASGKKVVHVFEQEGSYEVELSTIDENNEATKTTQTIIVTADTTGITPKIVASPLTGPSPLKVNFNGSGSTHTEGDRSLTVFEWDFGDNTPMVRSREVNHVYREDGTYTATLTVSDDMQNSKQETIEIIVTDELLSPEAKIISEPAILIGEAPFEVEFNGNQSIDKDGDIVVYKWNFGDGSDEEMGAIIKHTFSDTGNYNVVLTVEDNDGKIGNTSSFVSITDVGKKPPVVILSSDPTPPQGTMPFIITLDASESYDPDGKIISYLWNFGDDTREVQTTAPNTTHKYTKVGIWPVTVTATDTDGLSTESIMKVAVNNIPPKAEISTDKSTGYAPATIQFDASESAGNITSYTWDFGGGDIEKGMVVEHEFESEGIFRIKLTVEDSEGQIDSTEKTVTIN